MRVKKNYCTDPIQRANTTLPLSRHLLFTWHTSRLRFSVNKGKKCQAAVESFETNAFCGEFLDWFTAASNSEFLHPHLKSGTLHSEARRGTLWSSNNPAAFFERTQYLLAFGFFENSLHVP